MISARTDGRQWMALIGAAVVSVSLAVPETVSSQTVTAPVQRTAYSPDSPTQWLSYEGKSDAWYTATEPCRHFLDQLRLDDRLVKQHLPHIRRYAEMLGRVSGFNWKTVTALEFLQSMLEDLAAGKPPNIRYAGKGMAFPYWSDTMRRIEAIWTHVPPDYDPTKSYQVFMYYKCGGGIHSKNGRAAGGYRPTVEVANQTDTFHCWSSLNIQIKGRMGGHIELSEAMDALCRESYVLSQPGAEGAVGGATLLLMRLANQADKDLAVQVVLNRPVMSRVHGEVWPDASSKDKGAYFGGYHRVIGRYRQPPDHEDGVLFLSAGKPPTLSKLIADSAGYNFGLVGLEYQATIRAGRALVVPVLAVWVARPEKAAELSLLDVLMAVKADLIRQLPAEAVGR